MNNREPRKRRRSGAVFCVIALILIAAVVRTVSGSRPSGGDGVRDRCTVLIAGTDEEGYRTDTIMLLSVDKDAGTASLLSIPRDTYVNAPYSVPKINSACGYGGGGKRGMDELMTQVETLLGFRPDGYALIDLNAFVRIVDFMGGVEFDVPVDMQYSDPTQDLYIDLRSGLQHLNGEDALGLVRFRSGYAMADITRTSVQRDFVVAAARQWTGSVFNVIKLPVAAVIASAYVETDLTARNLAWLGRTLIGCDLSTMQTDILPGTPQYINGLSCYVPDSAAVGQLMQQAYNPNR